MSNRYDVCAPRAKKDGTTFWVKVGSAWQGDKGIQVVFDALPLPDKDGRVSVNLFEPREQGEARHQSRPQSQDGGIGPQEDYPF